MERLIGQEKVRLRMYEWDSEVEYRIKGFYFTQTYKGSQTQAGVFVGIYAKPSNPVEPSS